MTSERTTVFDRRAAQYEDYSNWTTSRELYDLCVEPLRELPSNAYCVDLGGGSGWIARTNTDEERRKWWVLDCSPKMALHTKSPTLFVAGDLERLPFRTGSFDYAIIRSVLQFVHVPKALAETRRVLRGPRVLVVAQKVHRVPPESTEWHRLVLGLRNSQLKQPFTEAELAKCLHQAGFRIRQQKTFDELRSVSLDRWISKDGTVSEANQRRVRELLANPPPSAADVGLVIRNERITYTRRWAICTCHSDFE